MDRNNVSTNYHIWVREVALRKESVDRNLSMGLDGRFKLVALRKESVDRNDVIRPAIDVFLAVALRKESVDRNIGHRVRIAEIDLSLSARRAWIEMIDNLTQGVFNLVALRKESVDRNLFFVHVLEGSIRSLSARRAWIEMSKL